MTLDATRGSNSPWLLVRYVPGCLAALLLVFESWELLRPPFTDVQIRESIVDTWEPHAYVTLLVLLVLLVIAVPAGLIAALVVRRIKALAFTTFALSLATMVVAIFNHARLTHRVTALTGQEFGRLWGLL